MLSRLLVLSTFLLGACATAPSRSVVHSSMEPLTAGQPRPAMPERTEAVHIVQAPLGVRKIDSDFDPADGQVAWGFEYAFQPKTSWLGVEAGAQFGAGSDEEGAVDVTTAEFEFYAGPRMTFLRQHIVQPYVGLGVTVITIGLDLDDGVLDVDDDDTSLGFYGHAGIAVNPVMGLRFGIEGRAVLGTDVTLFGLSTDADYTQVAGFVGWGF